MATINTKRIQKEVRRIYGIENQHLVQTILKEANAFEMLAFIEKINEQLGKIGAGPGEWAGKLFEESIKVIEKATR